MSEVELMDYLIKGRKIFSDNYKFLIDRKEEGEIVTDEQLDEAILRIIHVNEALGGLNSQIKMAEDGTKVVVRSDLRRLVNEVR